MVLARLMRSDGASLVRPGPFFALHLGMPLLRPQTCVLLLALLLQLVDAPHAFSDGGPLAHLVAPPPTVPWEGHHDTPSAPEALAFWRHFYDHSDLPLLTAMGREPQAIREAYLRILDHWVDGYDSDSVELLAELHHRLRDRGNCYPLESRRALKGMGASVPGSVLPAALLHAYALEHQMDNRRFRSFEINAEHIERLIKIHVESNNGSLIAKSEAADLATFVAERFWDSGYRELLLNADLMLDLALKLKPDHVAARYLRSMVAEKQGFYRRALRDLEALSRLRPLQADITLRLAVNHARRGKAERAGALLDGLIQADLQTPEWVRQVAFQERIRLAVEDGHGAKARRLLDQAREQFPKNVRFLLIDLEIQRASTGKADPRSRVLLHDWSVDEGMTERLRYLQVPVAELTANRNRLQEMLEHRQEALKKGVKKLRFGGESVDPCAGLFPLLHPNRDDPPASPTFVSAVEEADREPAAVAQVAALSPRALELPPPARVAPPPSGEETESSGDRYVDPDTGEVYVLNESLDLELQQLYVTPRRLGPGRPELTADQVTVSDEGRRQKIITFEQGDIPFTATLLLDASGSMRGSRLQQALAGAEAFLQDMADDDRTRVVLAADRLRGVAPFVDNRPESIRILSDRLDATEATGGTALFDHLFLTLDALEPEQGRKVVVLLSDGYDQTSVVAVESVREIVRRSQIQLYWIRLQASDEEPVPYTAWQPVGETKRQITHFSKTVRDSGGRVVEIQSLDEVADALARVLSDLRNQVAIGYYPHPSRGDGSWREVDVKAKGLGIRLRHAAGYFDG